MKKLIAIVCAVILLASCGQHPVSAILSSTSPDGKTVIHVNAKKEVALDPFTVTLNVKSGDIPDGSLQFEIAASALDSSNVTFDWKDAQNCLITFTQSDGDKRIFTLQASATNLIVEEVKKD